MNLLLLTRATHWGELKLGDIDIPCYVLANGERIFSLKGVVVALTGTAGGQLAEYIKVKSIRDYLPEELVPAENGSIPALTTFDTGNSAFAKTAIGVPVERFIDICIAYSTALQESILDDNAPKLTASPGIMPGFSLTILSQLIYSYLLNKFVYNPVTLFNP